MMIILYLTLIQFMETTRIGLSGRRALPPATTALKQETGTVQIQSLNMGETTAQMSQ